jgi:serine protease Do
METAPVNRQQRVAAACCLIAGIWTALGPLAAASPAADPPATVADEPTLRTAAWPAWLGGGRQLYNRSTVPAVPDTPHPAVARIIVPEDGATAYGSGTLVDVREQFGLVITNWHVVRDSQGTVEVVFPSGFRSHARPLKVDSDWDLAALVIWRPPIEPVRVSATPPRPGDLLTIHGYGQGQYRIATGRCTAFYAPKVNYPREMVELDVQARQGDSGGPIFNQRGELAGVLFGAGEGTTIGSFAPRVESFLATLAPDIGDKHDQAQVAIADRPAPNVHPLAQQPATDGLVASATRAPQTSSDSHDWPSSPWNPSLAQTSPIADAPPTDRPATEPVAWNDVAETDWYDSAKTVLALVGLAAVALQLMRLVK